MTRVQSTQHHLVEAKKHTVWRRWNVMLNALLVIAALLIVAWMAWGLDTQDIIVEWTPEARS